ncbi:MAG: DUF2384 domain-containing protein [Chitinophagales bacterium]|nr:DUF2384 domain-containing protein [Chitinophagales bacterium]
MKKHKIKEEEGLFLNEPQAVYGISDDIRIYALIEKIKNGISFHAFNNMAKKSPFKITEWAGFLHISDRTMQRYQKENKTFEAIHTEKIYEVSMLTNYGVQVFGSLDNFNQWLNAKNLAMGGLVPKTLLDNTFGIQAIKDELGRIEHGVFA